MKTSSVDTKTIKKLNLLAVDVREATLEMIYETGSGHIGPALSIADIITLLLFYRMNWSKHLKHVKGKAPLKQWKYWHDPSLCRDRFVISKGHGVPSWYAALAIGGYIKPEELKELRKLGSRLQGHPERKRFPFVDGTTGSLGQGQSEALGYALANKTQNRKEKVYCIIGDGESNEGQVWEAALSAPKFKLDNLVYIIDFNKGQGEGTNKEIMDIEPLHKKWQAFNWHVQRIDGHDMKQLLKAYNECDRVKGKPHVIVADTRKGYLGNGKVFMGGGHNPVIDENNFQKSVELLASIRKSYGA